MPIFSSLSHLPVLNSGQLSTNRKEPRLEAQNALRKPSIIAIANKETKENFPVDAELALRYFVPIAQNNRVREGMQQILQRQTSNPFSLS